MVGKFDGKCPTLAAGTTGGKIVLHSPHEGSQGRDGTLPPVRLLNFNKKITSMAKGSLIPEILGVTASATKQPADALFVGTESNLLAYDVERNADLFFRDMQDGVNALVVGKLAGHSRPLVIAGGNCSIMGFDQEGSEAFWSVTGDNIASLALCDVDGDGLFELLVGSDDFEIRVFRSEEVVTEITESEKVLFLTNVQGRKFAYGLSNGTVGVYSGSKTRLWRVKTKNKVAAVESFDLDKDGVPEVITGWANGAFNVRKLENGELIYKDNMGSAVVGIVKADYRLDGKEEVMICSEAGEVRGYLPSAEVELTAMSESGIEKAQALDQKTLEELQAKKVELAEELKQLGQKLAAKGTGDAPVGALPAGTDLSYSLAADEVGCCVALRVEASTDVQIANIVAIDLEGGVLEGAEVLAVAPLTQSRVAAISLRPTKNQPCTLRVQTHVSPRAYTAQLHVFESEVHVPRFSAFKMIDESKNTLEPNSQVTVRINESLERLLDWVKTAFLLSSHLVKVNGDKVKICFVSVCRPSKHADASPGGAGGPTRGGARAQEVYEPQPLHIVGNKAATDDGKPGLRVRIRCDDMDLAADVIQDLARYFKIGELDAEADFPEDLAKFEEVVHQVRRAVRRKRHRARGCVQRVSALTPFHFPPPLFDTSVQVEDMNAMRVRLAADMADDSQRVKALVVRAEDCRLMHDMEAMRRAYTELFALNSQLTVGYNVRAGNQASLLAALKEVNQMIQRAANLRVGKAKTSIIADCRASVKANNFAALSKIIRFGTASGPTKSGSGQNSRVQSAGNR